MTMPLAEIDRLATMLRSLAHPARLQIVSALARAGDATCLDLTREVALAQSTVSEHIRVLKEAGLVEQSGAGPRSGYCIRRDALVWVKQMVVAL